MYDKKKKFLPQLKKSIKKFLTDESGKITKKDALGVSAGVAFLSLADDVVAGHSSHTSYSNRWSSVPVANATYVYGVPACSHGSGIVNGHSSANAGFYWSPKYEQVTHSSNVVSHTNHSNY